MNTFKRIFAILVARNKEFIRDTGALAWNFIFPFMAVFIFGFAFGGKSQDLYKVGIYHREKVSPAAKAFLETPYVQFIDVEKLERAQSKVSRHQLDLLVSFENGGEYWVNSSSSKGYFLEKALVATQSGLRKQQAEGKEVRYVDWLLPGLLAMNMMFSALFGVGYTIVRYRKTGVLKRLKSTPLRASEFLLAQVLSRLILILGSSTITFIGCKWMIGFEMRGSYFDLLIVATLGSICMISLGLLIASRFASEELAGGILNAISWPMMFLSGVWYSLEGAHTWVIRLSQVFPLTHVVDASRSIMVDGAGLPQLQLQLLLMASISALFLFIGATVFRWN